MTFNLSKFFGSRGFSLLVLKLTWRPTSGGLSLDVVLRGFHYVLTTPSELCCTSSGNCDNPATPVDTLSRTILDTLYFRSTSDNLVEPTGHELDRSI